MEQKRISLSNFPTKVSILFWPMSILSFCTVLIDFSKLSAVVSDDSIHTFFITFDCILKIWWSLSIGWITIACHFGQGGVVQTFLSCRIFKTAAKLSLGIYMVHLVVQFWVVYLQPGYSRFDISSLVSI